MLCLLPAEAQQSHIVKAGAADARRPRCAAMMIGSAASWNHGFGQQCSEQQRPDITRPHSQSSPI